MRKSLVALSVIFMVYGIWAQSSYKRASSAAMTVHFPPAAIAAFQKIDAERIRAHVRFLSHDLLEGRGTGQRGGDIAAEYIATQFALYGLKPAGDNGTYMQRVPMVGVTPLPETRIFSGSSLRLAEGIEATHRLCCLRRNPAAGVQRERGHRFRGVWRRGPRVQMGRLQGC